MPPVRTAVPADLTPLALYRSAAPVVHGSGVFRVLESTAGQRVVQEWNGEYWFPSLLPLYELRDARLATQRDLQQRHVPVADRTEQTSESGWMPPTLTRLPHQNATARPGKSHAS